MQFDLISGAWWNHLPPCGSQTVTRSDSTVFYFSTKEAGYSGRRRALLWLARRLKCVARWLERQAWN